MLLPPLVLALLGLLFGIMPATVDPLLAQAARAMAPELAAVPVEASYDCRARCSTALALTLAFGGAIYACLGSAAPHARTGKLARRLRPGRLVPARAAGAQPHRRLAHARACSTACSDRYLLTVAGGGDGGGPAGAVPCRRSLAVAGGRRARACRLVAGRRDRRGRRPGDAVPARDRFVLLLASGLVGYGCAALFLFAGAPDLAFTQFAVETVFVVVAAAVLPEIRGRHAAAAAVPPPARIEPLKLLVAVAFGTTLSLYLLLAAGAAASTRR